MYIGLSALARLRATMEIKEIDSCRKASIRTTNDENVVCMEVLLGTFHDGVITGWRCGVRVMSSRGGQSRGIWNDHAVRGFRGKYAQVPLLRHMGKGNEWARSRSGQWTAG